MLYFRVRNEYDYMPMNPKNPNGEYFIAKRLYTSKEFDELVKNGMCYKSAFELVTIDEENTIQSFNSRFEKKNTKHESNRYLK